MPCSAIELPWQLVIFYHTIFIFFRFRTYRDISNFIYQRQHGVVNFKRKQSYPSQVFFEFTEQVFLMFPPVKFLKPICYFCKKIIEKVVPHFIRLRSQFIKISSFSPDNKTNAEGGN